MKLFKTCTRCKESKQLDSFPSGNNWNDGKYPYCYNCKRVKQREYRDRHREAISKRAKAKYCPVKNRESELKKKYGITIKDFDSMVMTQGNKCAICKNDTPGGKYNVWCVDHCHTTGKIRGILCHYCNAGLGHFKDDIKFLASAIEYLKLNKGD